MPLRWNIFRIICIVQVMATGILSLYSLIRFFQFFSFGGFIGMVVFVLAMLLGIQGIQLLQQNYPNSPVAGKQKTIFNRLYLVNFLSLVVFFGFIFSELRIAKQVAVIFNTPLYSLPFSFLYPLLMYIGLLVLQLAVLYGLFVLRRELFANFHKRSFDFEKQ